MSTSRELVSAESKSEVEEPSNHALRRRNHVLTNPMFRPRHFRSKGALLTLVWNFVALVAFVSLIVPTHVRQNDSRYKVMLGLSVLIYPMAGWLGDVHFGRYRILKASMLLMWLASILFVTAVITKTQLDPGNTMRDSKADIFILFTVLLSLVGLSAYQANAVQFGIDQLVDASSSTISSYISWYAWCLFLAYALVIFSQVCTCPQYAPVSSLLLPFLLTACLCSDVLCGSWLVKEPASFNPLKLIFRVLRYAVKHKYPQQRSAFTYWEDKPYTRIDLAKDKYGGPFSTEQVEDVKTFFRILVVVLLGCFFVGLVYTVSMTVNQSRLSIHGNILKEATCPDINFSGYVKRCLEKIVVRSFGYVLMVVFIPFTECAVYPFLWKCFPRFSIMSKFTLGIFFELVYFLLLMTLEVVEYHVLSTDSTLEAGNATCALFNHTAGVVEAPSYYWMMLPKAVNGVGLYCLLTSAVEFVCAQAPYTMKGLVGGIIYLFCFMSVFVSLGVRGLFQVLFEKKDFGKDCGVWYYLSVSLIALFWIVLAIVTTKLYSRRRRDENIHNEQIFAVNYYS